MGRAAVLIAEDNDEMRHLFHIILESAGFDVTEAEDGEMALRALDHARPDLLLTDLMMPRVDGIELIRRVRERAELADLPIVAMSAYGSDHLAKAYVTGATATIRKPLDPDNLIDTIIDALPEPATHGH